VGLQPTPLVSVSFRLDLVTKKKDGGFFSVVSGFFRPVFNTKDSLSWLDDPNSLGVLPPLTEPTGLYPFPSVSA